MDACRHIIDSVAFSGDSILVYERGDPSAYGLSSRRGDTLIYAGVLGFLRQTGPAGRRRYFFGYCHRCDDERFRDALWAELIPAGRLGRGKAFAGGNQGILFTCEESAGSEPQSAYAEYDISTWVVGELMNIKAIRGNFQMLEIEVRTIPGHAARPAGERATVKELMAGDDIDWRMAPVTEEHLARLRLTEAQRESLGISKKRPAAAPSLR